MFLLFVLGCTVTDGFGTSCPAAEAVSDGFDAWCPQADAPEQCADLTDAIVFYERRCLMNFTENELLRAIIDSDLQCDSAVVVLPEVTDCLAMLKARPCPTNTSLPAECSGIILGE